MEGEGGRGGEEEEGGRRRRDGRYLVAWQWLIEMQEVVPNRNLILVQRSQNKFFA